MLVSAWNHQLDCNPRMQLFPVMEDKMDWWAKWRRGSNLANNSEDLEGWEEQQGGCQREGRLEVLSCPVVSEMKFLNVNSGNEEELYEGMFRPRGPQMRNLCSAQTVEYFYSNIHIPCESMTVGWEVESQECWSKHCLAPCLGHDSQFLDVNLSEVLCLRSVSYCPSHCYSIPIGIRVVL